MISLIKETRNGKSDENFVKLKLCRDPRSIMLDLYEFKMYLFENGNPEQFMLFVCNFNTTLAVTGILGTDANIQYLCTIVRWEALLKFDLLSAHVEYT